MIDAVVFIASPPALNHPFGAARCGAGVMMRRRRTDLPDDAANLTRKKVAEFIESLDEHGLRELRHVAKGLERYTTH